MYSSGQVVHDLDKNVPIKCGTDAEWQSHPAKRTIHYVDANGVFVSTDLEKVKIWLAEGRIQPAPIPYTHCTKCMNWLSNHARDGSCW